MDSGTNRDDAAIGKDTSTVTAFHGASVNGETRAYSAIGEDDASTTLITSCVEEREYSCSAPPACTCACHVTVTARAFGGFSGYCAGGDLSSSNTIDMLVLDQLVDAKFEITPKADPFSKDKKIKVKVNGKKGDVSTEVEFEYEWHKKLPQSGHLTIKPLEVKRTYDCTQVECITTLGLSAWDNSYWGKTVRVTADFTNQITHVDVTVDCSCPQPRTVRLTPTPWTGEDAALIDSQIFRVSDTIDKLYGAAAATAKQKQAPVTRIENRFESRLAEHIGELSEAVVSEWQVEELLRMRDAIAGLTPGGGAEPISDEREGGQARPRRQRRERADESTLVAREAELRGAIVALERVRELARDDVRFEPDDFDRILDDASQLLEDTPDAGDKAVPHRGMWTNKTGQTVNDLHVTFDRPGVKWVDPNGQRGYFPSGRDATPASEAGTKTEIDLYGGNVTANSPARGKFTRDGGDFKVESWYWTLDGEKVGDTITDPPDQWE